MIADPNSDLVQQLTRIADALNKPGPSAWIEWAKSLASFVAGIALTYLGIFLQNRTGDRREQQKMRRIVYSELSYAIFWLYDIVRNMPKAKAASDIDAHDAKRGFRDPPAMRIANPSLTFEGEEYMRNHQNVAYELPEMAFLKRTYSELHLFSANQTMSVGEFKSTLTKISKEIKTDPLIKNNFKQLVRCDFAAIEAIANHFAELQIKPEELLRVVFEKEVNNV